MADRVILKRSLLPLVALLVLCWHIQAQTAQTTLTCPESGSVEPCQAFHFHVEIWLPDLNSFQHIYGFGAHPTLEECQAARDSAAFANAELIGRLRAGEPERTFQANRFGQCHCDRTTDRANAFFLSDAQRRAQLRVAQSTEESLKAMAEPVTEITATDQAVAVTEVAEPSVQESEASVAQEDLLAAEAVPPAPSQDSADPSGAAPTGAEPMATTATEGMAAEPAPVPPAEAAAAPAAPAPPSEEPRYTEAEVIHVPPANEGEAGHVEPAPSAEPAASAAAPVPVAATTAKAPAPAQPGTTRVIATEPVQTPAAATAGTTPPPSRGPVVVQPTAGASKTPIEIRWSKDRSNPAEPAPAAAAAPGAAAAASDPGAAVDAPPAPAPPTDDSGYGENPFIAYETARVQEILKASFSVSDETIKAGIFEAAMQRLQVIANLRALEEGAAKDTVLPAAMRAAVDDASRLAFVTQIFGATVASTWVPKDARDVIMTLPPEINEDPGAVLRLGVGADRRKLALYVVLARSSPLTAEQETSLASTIDAFLRTDR